MPLPVSLGESTTSATPVTLQSPMANLMSITETLPPGSPRSGPSPPGPPPPRTASRSSQHSPNSSGKCAQFSRNDSGLGFHNEIVTVFACFFFCAAHSSSGSSSGRRSSGSRHVSSTTVTSSEAQQNQAGLPAGVSVPVSNASNPTNAPPTEDSSKCIRKFSTFFVESSRCATIFS